MRDAETQYLRRELQPDNRGEAKPVARVGQAIGMFLGLPELRAFWPFSSVNESGQALDLSGQARTLSNNGTIGREARASGVPYSGPLNGTTQYWSRASEAGLAITGGLTVGGWFFPTSLATDQMLITKLTTTGNQRTFMLYVLANGSARLAVSGDGTNLVFTAGAAGGVVASSQWYFIAGRYTPSTELASWCNATKVTNTTSIPASLYNSTAPLLIGGWNGGAAMTGYVGMSFICAAALSDAVIANLYTVSRALFQ